MRRRGPRPLAGALEVVTRATAPATLLARVQACWPEAVGAAIAAEARPVSEREGTLVIACRSGTWANELELLAPSLKSKLNEVLGDSDEGPVKGLRAKVGDPP